MSSVDLSIIIPARGEEFLARTIQDLFENIEGNTEVIAVLDGYLPAPPLSQADSRLRIIYNPVSIGQRAAMNQAARLSQAKYIMKVDAHCAFDKGFDRKLMEDMQDNWTMAPLMRNLHVFDWVCSGGHRRYQGKPSPCTECGQPTTKDIIWIAKPSPQSTSFRFDRDMHFQYFGEYKKRQEGDLVESMSLQGSCFMCTRAKYWELGLCDEAHGSWGQQGTEVACKTWLSGGKVIISKKTWYAHLFRTQEGFSFPYPNSGIHKAREYSKNLWLNNKWDKAKYPLSWLIEKFAPVPGWDETEKGIIFYSDGELDSKVFNPVVQKLKEVSKEKGLPIVTAALKRKLDFGDKNIYFPSLKRGYLTMFKQILGALENSSAEYVFFCEHDVLYHPSHFDFTPTDKETFYYNQNIWLLRVTDGHALHYAVNQLSGLCIYRETAITHFRERIELIEKEGFSRNVGFEPFTHSRIVWKNQFKHSTWKSEFPNIDIKHGANATGQRWRKDQYRNQQLLVNWTESENWQVAGWGFDLKKLLG